MDLEEELLRSIAVAPSTLDQGRRLRCCVSRPLCSLGWKAFHQDLGANPIEYITHATGDWTLRFLGSRWRSRRAEAAGRARTDPLPADARAVRVLLRLLHLTTYLWLDKFFDARRSWRT